MLGRGVLPVWIRVGQRSVTLLTWIRVGQGPTALAVGAGGGCLDIFTLVYHFSFFSPALWETARYRLKYCLKGPLSPKQPTNQPTVCSACNRCGWGLSGHFFSRLSLLFSFSSLWETAQYRLKYCLKEPLSPKQPTNQPTFRQLFHIDKILSQSAVKPKTTDQPTNQHKDPLIIYSLIKVFSSTNCPYHGMKVTCFGKSMKVFTGALSSFTIKSLQNNTYNAINK